MKPHFENTYTKLQMDVINRLAEIEQADANACANCGGEDCMCCEIYHDRQKWVEPDELFSRKEVTEMVWRVIEHIGYSVVAVQDFETEDDALEYKANYDKTHCHPCWVSISYCKRDDVAYYSNS